VFLQETIAEPRSFPNVLRKVALMVCDYRAVRDRVVARFPIMRSNTFERRMLFERPARKFPPVAVEAPALQLIAPGR
jgi:hypothetical protein